MGGQPIDLQELCAPVEDFGWDPQYPTQTQQNATMAENLHLKKTLSQIKQIADHALGEDNNITVRASSPLDAP